MNEITTGRFFALLREVPQEEQTTVGMETWQSAYIDLEVQALQLSDSTDLSATFRSLHALRLELVSTEVLYPSRPGEKCA